MRQFAKLGLLSGVSAIAPFAAVGRGPRRQLLRSFKATPGADQMILPPQLVSRCFRWERAAPTPWLRPLRSSPTV